jgi:hypothetical protein
MESRGRHMEAQSRDELQQGLERECARLESGLRRDKLLLTAPERAEDPESWGEWTAFGQTVDLAKRILLADRLVDVQEALYDLKYSALGAFDRCAEPIDVACDGDTADGARPCAVCRSQCAAEE